MQRDGKLMDMLTGYAASHQHPFNVCVHLIGIPTIMFGILIPLSWASVEVAGFSLTLAHATVVGFCLFYLTLDTVFAGVFFVLALLLTQLAAWVGSLPYAVSGSVAAGAFAAGYAGQFIGHAVEKSMPVLIRHPVQANLVAPLFQIVEMFKILGLRRDLFDDVQANVRKTSSQPGAVKPFDR